MKLLIFDNDAKYAEHLMSLLVKLRPEEASPLVNVTAAEFAEIVESGEITVVFIDTKFRTANSNFLRFARRIRDMSDACHICFVSSYPSDVAFCYKKLVRPSGFLLMPVEEDELSLLLSEITAYEKDRRIDVSTPDVVIKSKGETKILRMSDVLYFTAVEKKLFCYTTDGSELAFYGTLSKIEKDYSKYLLRCHNGFLVNKNKIDGFSKSTMMLHLRGYDAEIPVSKSRYKDVEDLIKGEKNEKTCDK